MQFERLLRLQALVEQQAFGVCTKLGDFTGVATSSIRLFFIYASFLTIGSPIIVYMSLAFLINMRRHLRLKLSPFREL